MQKKIRFLENEISACNVLNHTKEDKNGKENVGKPGTPAVQERIFKTRGIKDAKRWKWLMVGRLGLEPLQRTQK